MTPCLAREAKFDRESFHLRTLTSPGSRQILSGGYVFPGILSRNCDQTQAEVPIHLPPARQGTEV